MAEVELDVELLIALVEERPVLWDKTLDIYKNKNLTAEAWKEICSTLLEKYDTADEETKNEIGKSVQKRWTNLRDAWMKSVKKDNKKTFKGAKPAKKYIYHEQMIFLKKNSLIDAMSNATEEKDPLSPKEESNIEPPPSISEPSTSEQQPNSGTKRPPELISLSTKEPKKRKIEIDSVEEKILQELQKKPEENRHMSFFKSTLPSIDTFTDEQVMDFQMGVLSLIKDIRRTSNMNNPYTSNPSSPMDIKPSWITSETSIDYVSGLHTSISISEDVKPPKFTNDHEYAPSSPSPPAADAAPRPPRQESNSEKDDYVCFCCWKALYPRAAVEYLHLHSLHGSHSQSVDSSAADQVRSGS